MYINTLQYIYKKIIFHDRKNKKGIKLISNTDKKNKK